MTGDPRAAALKTAALYNLPLLLGFGATLGIQLFFWLSTLKPFRADDMPPPAEPSWPWAAASVVLAFASQALPAAYLRPKRFELSGGLYRALGIPAFRRIMTNGDLINRRVRRRHPDYVVHAGREALDAAVKATLHAERGHLLFFVLSFGAGLYAWRIGWTGWAIWHLASNIPCNLYPILLQRYTRARIMRAAPETVARALA